MRSTDFGRSGTAAPLQQPMPVEPFLEVKQRLPEFLDGGEGPHPQKLLLQRPENRSATPLPSGARTKLGLDSMPRNRVSA